MVTGMLGCREPATRRARDVGRPTVVVDARPTDLPRIVPDMEGGDPVLRRAGLPVHKVATPPRIDGRLDDPAWRSVKPLTEFHSCASGRPAPVTTEVRLAYDKRYLYFSYRMEEPALDRARATVRRHDGEVWRDDRAETFFWFPGGSGRGYYQLMVNLLNTHEDARDLKAGAWDPSWTSAVQRSRGAWSVEARIAFSELRQPSPEPGTRWRANFGRERYAALDHYSWAKITGSFHQKEAFRSIVFWGDRENTPPGAIKDLTVEPGRFSGEVRLGFAAPGDDGQSGTASSYDVRYSRTPVEGEAGFARATRVEQAPAPAAAGQRERLTVQSLEPGQRLYFALRAVDDSGNVGPVAAASEAVVVPAGGLSPQALSIEPTLVSAGVILAAGRGVDPAATAVRYRRAGQRDWRRGHPLTRVDAGHLATSLFNLAPGVEYELALEQRGRRFVNRFRTRPEPVIPAPLRVVQVRDDAALRRALAAARPGDEVRIHPGTYRGPVRLTRSGSAEHPIVLRGVVAGRDARRPVWQVRGLPVIDGGGRSQSGLLLEGSPGKLIHHVVVDHLQVRNAREVGIHLVWAAWCVVQHCQAYDNGSYTNVHVNKGGPQGGRHLIQYNHIADLKHGPRRYTHEEQRDVTYYGFKQDNYCGPGTIVRGNRIEGHSDGIHPSGDEADAPQVAETLPDVRRRWYNHSTDIHDNVILDHLDDAIEADGVAINMRIFRNRMDRSQNAISVSPSMPGPFFIFGNVAEGFHESCVKLNTGEGRGMIRNIFFYNNTFVHGGRANPDTGGAIMTLWAGTPSRNIVYRNNIFVGKHKLIDFQDLPHRPDMDHDLWFTTQGKGAFGAAGARFRRGGVRWEPHGLFADPRLDRSGRPGAASPARGKGTPVPGLSEGSVDIGAL